MDLIVEVSEWCYFERIRDRGFSYCELLDENPRCEFGRTGEPARECPFLKGRIILEWKNE